MVALNSCSQVIFYLLEFIYHLDIKEVIALCSKNYVVIFQVIYRSI